MLLLGEDGIVGVDAVLLEHSLIAGNCQLSSVLISRWNGLYPKPVHRGRLASVLMGGVWMGRTEDVQERVLQAEELVAVGCHFV